MRCEPPKIVNMIENMLALNGFTDDRYSETSLGKYIMIKFDQLEKSCSKQPY